MKIPRSAGVSPASLSASELKRASVSTASKQQEHKGWHSRGYLPHCDSPNLLQSITFRLADALPQEVLARLNIASVADEEKHEYIDTYLDQGHGSCLLRDFACADIVQTGLQHFHGQRYRLIEWCVMPNHVHVLIETFAGWTLNSTVHSWKSFTAKAINRHLGRSGTLWQADYFDRFIRDDAHLQAVREYIRTNPVKAGFCDLPEEWLYSSAYAEHAMAGETPALLDSPLSSGALACQPNP